MTMLTQHENHVTLVSMAELTDGDAAFAEAMKRRRIELGISQAALASELALELGRAVSQQAVALMEAGSRRVTVGEAQVIASVLETDVDYLLHGRLSGREAVATLGRALDRIAGIAGGQDVRRAIWSVMGESIKLNHLDHAAWMEGGDDGND
ncbi:helix-turn-helix domain-containing protein [Microbacterium sp. cx-55]|uniref:helix-turn-helix transcriptional regulator n=1 Tax=Microbacterium sp. cx-55 TaxID=2875948 RepID=UPI001CC1189D|nr:helix-turn-helix transcriptional regulator [Microbacterium sp. cx-55]MBZ4485980.1 helix-turn-helix domain-containing protein [Microbacterium sp. cx-55]UGB34146.1 helix-turn-helix domain-containing protein [Microbacterium sp. cx-55]